MKTIINTSSVTDYSGEPPVVTYSNPVDTVIRQTPPPTVITRVFRFIPCGCCDSCNCGCGCGCNFNDN